MAKILAVSDVHIYDYPQRNPIERYRLLQTRVVAQNIIEAGKQYGCEYIVLAGDILEKQIVRPYVQAEVKLFLDTLMEFFKEGFIIWGNHDIDNKSNLQKPEDSCLSVMLPRNLYYSDGKQIRIGSSEIAFSNWKPEFDLSWIQGTVDVLFTHATICYSAGDHVVSQVLDESKFNLAICGDIHRMAQLGKFVSIGIPQICKVGDSEHCSGVVYDTETKQWGWVNLNPKNNLLRFQYTTDAKQEGFNHETGTWQIYRPNRETTNEAGLKTIAIPEASEVEELIKKIIFENGLSNVHAEVLRNCGNVESLEVDFNFILTRFYCKNWRSIEEAELFFSDRDKILIRGANGSGKSSFLSAIKYAFTENRFIKEFTQFGAKECLTEVEFWYQGKKCRLQRGSKKYGLWIDDVQMNYGNKREFEDNIHERFPFIDYMDIFFFDEDHLKLIGDLQPERKSEIISKFYKLDKIDYFNQVALDMVEIRKKSISGIKEEAEICKRMIEEISGKLDSLQIPTVELEQLQERLKYLEELQRKDQAYRRYQDSCLDQMAKLKMYEAAWQKANEKLSQLPQYGILQSELGGIDEEIEKLKLQENSIRTARETQRNLERDITRINTEGSKLYQEKELLLQSRCPTCKQIVPRETLTEELEKCDSEMTQLLRERENLVKDLNEVKSIIGLYPTGISEEIRKLEQEKLEIQVKLSEILSTKKECQESENMAKRIKAGLDSQDIPEKVELPDGIYEEMNLLRDNIQAWNLWNTLETDRINYTDRLKYCQDQIGNAQEEIKLLDIYVDITGTTGKIYEEIMNRLSKEFTDNLVKYEVNTYEFRKKKHLDLASYYNNSGHWVSYQSASSGQKTVLDINFLSKIVTRMGLLIMDEFLKSLDSENHDLCIDMINGMNVSCIMLSSHMETIGKFNNKSINFALNDSGSTIITPKFE